MNFLKNYFIALGVMLGIIAVTLAVIFIGYTVGTYFGEGVGILTMIILLCMIAATFFAWAES